MSQPAEKRRKTDTGGTNVVDARFANIQSDPRYRLPGKRQKIKVDKRFAKALEDEDFSRKAKVDRYGRRLEADSERRRLKRKYEFEEDEEPNQPASDEADDDNDVQAELKRVAQSRDVLREGKDVSSSEDESSEEEESNDEEEEEVDELGPGVQDQDVPTGDVSSRMAIVNLDWDNIRAEDLMAVFQSFLPATGRLLKVAIYPSEFGKERMEREEMEGPPKEIFARKTQSDASESDADSELADEEIKNSIIQPDDGSEFDSAALRQYQLERLRYYYAVLTFSDSKTAKQIYDAVDGTEYLSTANFFDLRFVPDETDFSDDTPREDCERLPVNYKPNEFVTDALQHSKVKLTWDADDNTRKEAQARAFRPGRKEIDENDLKAYLGSDTGSEDEDEDEIESATAPGLSRKDAERQRMRALLGLASEPERKSGKDKKNTPLGNIQITFSSGLSGPADNSDEENKPRKKRSVFENSPEPNETTVEKYIRKEKERKQKRKEKMKATRTRATGTEDATAEDVTSSSGDEDQGFDDPFFTEPTNDIKSTHKQRKADRLSRRAEREAEEAASAKQRTQLEKLMADDDEPDKQGRTVKHFDMIEIEKAEKAMSKKKSKHRKADNIKTEHEAVLAADDFELNTADPRFARLYENHEFAIDPTNPRFKGTKGMKALLDEGRKRKSKDTEKRERTDDRKKESRGASNTGGDSGLMGLVEKIKRRNQ